MMTRHGCPVWSPAPPRGSEEAHTKWMSDELRIVTVRVQAEAESYSRTTTRREHSAYLLVSCLASIWRGHCLFLQESYELVPNAQYHSNPNCYCSQS
eukprot:58326-Amphidinium_carterae.1